MKNFDVFISDVFEDFKRKKLPGLLTLLYSIIAVTVVFICASTVYKANTKSVILQPVKKSGVTLQNQQNSFTPVPISNSVKVGISAVTICESSIVILAQNNTETVGTLVKNADSENLALHFKNELFKHSEFSSCFFLLNDKNTRITVFENEPDYYILCESAKKKLLVIAKNNTVTTAFFLN